MRALNVNNGMSMTENEKLTRKEWLLSSVNITIYTSEYCKHNNILGIASEYCEL